MTFHLGMDFSRDKDGTLCMSSKKYTEKIIANYERMYGESPKQNVTSPLEKGDHPEIDTSEFLDDNGIREYQSLIGSLQWLISIGRFDIMTAVMTMSSFRSAPRKGHLGSCEADLRLCLEDAQCSHSVSYGGTRLVRSSHV